MVIFLKIGQYYHHIFFAENQVYQLIKPLCIVKFGARPDLGIKTINQIFVLFLMNWLSWHNNCIPKMNPKLMEQSH